MRQITAILMIMIMCGISGPGSADESIAIVGATASSVYGTSAYYGPAEYAIDGETNTYWLSQRYAIPAWIEFDLGQQYYVNVVNIVWFSQYYDPENYDIQVSSDGANWDNVHTGISAVYSATGEERPIGRQARYVRLNINEVNQWGVVREFRAFAVSEVPRAIRFQGTLKDSSGMPLDSTYDVTFRIYDAETGGDIIWQESQAGLEITDGLLDVELGSVTGLDLAFDKPYYLSVEVGSDGEMTPRFKLTSVPYALRSAE